jgi:hypothetical protein
MAEAPYARLLWQVIVLPACEGQQAGVIEKSCVGHYVECQS